MSELLLGICFVWSDLCLAGRCFFFFQAEDGIRDLVRSRGLGDVYKRQALDTSFGVSGVAIAPAVGGITNAVASAMAQQGDGKICLLYTSDAADERSSVDLGGRRIIKKKKNRHNRVRT